MKVTSSLPNNDVIQACLTQPLSLPLSLSISSVPLSLTLSISCVPLSLLLLIQGERERTALVKATGEGEGISFAPSFPH